MVTEIGNICLAKKTNKMYNVTEIIYDKGDYHVKKILHTY